MFPEAVSTNTVWESWVTPKDHLGSSYFFPDFLSSPYSWHRELELAGVGERGEIRKKKKKSSSQDSTASNTRITKSTVAPAIEIWPV